MLGRGDSSLLGGLQGLLSNLHMPKLDMDDIILLGIAYLILRENGDDELLLIIAALFFLGVMKE